MTAGASIPIPLSGVLLALPPSDQRAAIFLGPFQLAGKRQLVDLFSYGEPSAVT
jgi:hypothetical protein